MASAVYNTQVVKLIEGIAQATDTQPVSSLQSLASEAAAQLSAMAVVNVELWAKLGRAAASRRLWPIAVQCCHAAMKVHTLTEASCAPGAWRPSECVSVYLCRVSAQTGLVMYRTAPGVSCSLPFTHWRDTE
jgi:hypothetical protein